MIRLLFASILFFIPQVSFANEKQREVENEAINLVVKKFGKGLENRLKGTGVTPSYRSWYENDCFVSIAAGTYQENTWSAMKWFSVNICSESAEIMESE
ncbi:MAG: heat-labile enterotoxin alpha chain [Prochlorococcus marinus CUG1431]|uniref:Heat-labile enterotoxin alpha chain n=1 Tax=Prochlorococcus marinus CUG1433 TaxID=2774506 RepID=A0A9D9BWX7_PROMR|nr:heat-labile enterotoxin alpha chain [Prochlorococcus marinus CUG1433]MBO6981344.1 heat-labile enterotoxin alpha chain [Prochlorococcus marinus CUG1431]